MRKDLALKEILKSDLCSFIHKVFTTINPGAEYASNWHIDLIAEYLLAVEKGEIKRLIINIPPRTLKSLSISIAWTAWLLGHNPALRIMSASYSQVISTKLSLDTRFVMNSTWYKNLFRKTRLHPKQNQKNKFMTTKYGFRFATSVGGSATGEGGDILILDDPHNPTDINSEKIRSKTINWFKETFSTRLNSREKGKIVVVMQRLHEGDLTGFLEANHKEEWNILKIPSIAHNDIEFKINNFNYVMKKNETIHNKLFSNEIINKLIKEIGNDTFEAQYQQNPNIYSAGMLQPDYIQYYDKLPGNISGIIQSWDTAIKTSIDSDFSACTIWAIKDNCYYLISCVEEKYEYPLLKKEVVRLEAQYKPQKILIEDKSSGHSLIQDLKHEGLSNIVACKPFTDKIGRFATILDLFEAGRVFIPKQGYTHHLVKKYLLNFPNLKHDDVIDSISQFLNFMKSSSYSMPKIRGL